eukprot:CAMPEP_0115858498 /NCGR_PEP_ID=MMETSP0287-20121206/16130_1 /TAXON_ID=412157 /ORGANISM="Chrysochromulina rotalis, Strain UIO044" /LENGTH=80 /DNA_ID=CAMNT_0003312767 /DNA_START=249 /DNA_END=488 /DNA_ORIENTATION=-
MADNSQPSASSCVTSRIGTSGDTVRLAALAAVAVMAAGGAAGCGISCTMVVEADPAEALESVVGDMVVLPTTAVTTARRR